MPILSVDPKAGCLACLNQNVIADKFATLWGLPSNMIQYFQGRIRVFSFFISSSIILDLFSHLILYHSHSFSSIPNLRLEAVQQPLPASLVTKIFWVLHSEDFIYETFINCVPRAALTDLHWHKLESWKCIQTCRTYLFWQQKSLIILRYQQTYSMPFQVSDCIKNH